MNWVPLGKSYKIVPRSLKGLISKQLKGPGYEI